MIKIENLEKSFGKNSVLNQLNAQFPSGEISGLVGRNGAGKTTLFQCIAGLEDYSGNISSNHTQLKDRIGYLSTAPFMLSRITGREYIQLLSNARGKNKDFDNRKNIFELPLDRYADKYSTGMKKKLALTAIMLLENDYYLFDEPFSGVDLDSNIIIKAIIKKLKDLGKTVIISSHIYDTLTQICDSISVLEKGKITRRVTEGEYHQLESILENNTVNDLVDQLF